MKPDNTEEARTIERLTEEWGMVPSEGALDRYLRYVTDDFIWLGSMHGAGFSGDELRQFLELFFETSAFSMKDCQTKEVVFSEDATQAVHVWEGTAVVENKQDGVRTTYRRRYFDMWNKIEGNWLCSRHLFLVIGDDI